MSTITKTFDAVDFQRKTRDKIDALTKDMSFEKRKKETKASVSTLKSRLVKLKRK